MRILAIETSCDESAIAIVDATGTIKNPKFSVKNSEVASQIKLHAKFGGVVPSLAKREHIKNLPILFEKIFGSQKISKKSPSNSSSLTSNPLSLISSIDLIAVTVGPGLEPALWTGIKFAEEIHEEIFNKKIPLVGVNHLEGHLYSFLLSERKRSEKTSSSHPLPLIPYPSSLTPIFPAIGLIVSGGHTILTLVKDLKTYRKLGETLDDAVGESFDKVARLLNLPYPGGPELEKLARKGYSKSINFPSPMIGQKNYNFSYSGLKTSVLYYLKDLGSGAKDFSLNQKEKQALKKIESKGNLKANIASSFQRAAFNSIIVKTARACKEFSAKSVVIGGGVSANMELRKMLKERLIKERIEAQILVPEFEYCLDNGVMIATAGYINYLKKKKHPLKANGILSL